MAMSVFEAEAMEAARAVGGRCGAVNFSYRNPRAFRYARSLVTGGALGRLMRANVVYLQSFMAASETLWSWRHDVAIAGFGALGDLGVHMVDAIRFITGLEFQRIVALTKTCVAAKRGRAGESRDITTDTHAMFLAQLDNDVMSMFETTQMALGYGDLFRIELSGEIGTLSIDSEHPDQIRLVAGSVPPARATWRTDLPIRDIPADFDGLDAPASPGALIDALQGKPVDYPTFADGVAAQRVLEAIVESTRSGAWCSVRSFTAV
jgi:predicted dehydrogenase